VPHTTLSLSECFNEAGLDTRIAVRKWKAKDFVSWAAVFKPLSRSQPFLPETMPRLLNFTVHQYYSTSATTAWKHSKAKSDATRHYNNVYTEIERHKHDDSICHAIKASCGRNLQWGKYFTLLCFCTPCSNTSISSPLKFGLLFLLSITPTTHTHLMNSWLHLHIGQHLSTVGKSIFCWRHAYLASWLLVVWAVHKNHAPSAAQVVNYTV